jgi:hypothetical protein
MLLIQSQRENTHITLVIGLHFIFAETKVPFFLAKWVGSLKSVRIVAVIFILKQSDYIPSDRLTFNTVVKHTTFIIALLNPTRVRRGRSYAVPPSRGRAFRQRNDEASISCHRHWKSFRQRNGEEASIGCRRHWIRRSPLKRHMALPPEGLRHAPASALHTGRGRNGPRKAARVCFGTFATVEDASAQSLNIIW